MSFKLIIAGGRDFNNPSLLKLKVENVLRGKNLDNVIVLSGKQVTIGMNHSRYGADYLGEQWAKQNGIPIEEHPANWSKLGNAAGPIRNAEMAKAADACIVFWDGKSRGTKSMIDEAKKLNLPLRIIHY